MQSEKETDDGGNEDGGADDIELHKALDERLSVRVVVAVEMKQEEDEDHGDATDGQVDVETPPPGCLLSEGASQERSSDGRDSPHAADQAEGQRALLQGHRVAENNDGAGEQARGADAGDGTPDDEGGRGRSQGAEQGSNLEDEDGCQVGVLDAEELVDRAIHGLQSGGGQQVSRAVPANVLDAAILGRDGAKGRGDDGLVEGHQEHGQAEGDDDEDELDAVRVLRLVFGGLVGRGGFPAVYLGGGHVVGRLLGED